MIGQVKAGAVLGRRDRTLVHRALTEMAGRFDARADELGTLVTKENGKKIAEGRLEGSSPAPRSGTPRPGP